MKNSINPKVLFYGAMLLGVLLAMVLDSCKRGPEIIVKVPAEAFGPDTIHFKVQGIKDDNTIILRNLSTGGTMLMEVENPYDTVMYGTGQLITLIK